MIPFSKRPFFVVKVSVVYVLVSQFSSGEALALERSPVPSGLPPLVYATPTPSALGCGITCPAGPQGPVGPQGPPGPGGNGWENYVEFKPGVWNYPQLEDLNPSCDYRMSIVFSAPNSVASWYSPIAALSKYALRSAAPGAEIRPVFGGDLSVDMQKGYFNALLNSGAFKCTGGVSACTQFAQTSVESGLSVRIEASTSPNSSKVVMKPFGKIDDKGGPAFALGSSTVRTGETATYFIQKRCP